MNRWQRWTTGIGALAMLLAVGCKPADHDEATDGDLSNDPAAPTALDFGLGSNAISGSVAAPGDARDFITFTIPKGGKLSAVRLVKYRTLPSGEPGNTGFHAINAGATSFIPNAMTAGLFLGGDHVTTAAEGTDLLPALADGMPAGTGFTPPLGPGVYSYLIQQTGPQLSGYRIELDVTH